jgi:nucleotide-binding universal stress UspA family protein
VAHTIVIGIEPDPAERVARVGGELARGLGARVVLAHVRNDPSRGSSKGDRVRARHRSARLGRELLAHVRAEIPPEVEVDERVEHGGVVTKLGDIAEETGAALVVVGSRGRGPIASALFGSVSQALSRTAPCPVMIVPSAPSDAPRPAWGERATMVAGLDRSASSSAAAHFAGALAQGLDHRLVVVQLRDGGRSGAQALHAISVSENARMIVVSGGSRNGNRQRPLRSLAARLPRLARCPVTVVPGGAVSTLDR